MTESQIKRLKDADINASIILILDTFLKNNHPITGKEYYELDDRNRRSVKEAFKNVFISHLRKAQLTPGELGVLSVAIPILLWKIQGKSFKEIVSLRHAYLTNKDLQREIQQKLRKGEFTNEMAFNEIKSISIKYSIIAHPLPDSSASTVGLFPIHTPIGDFDYDILVYDTYDYLDKVISLSIADPLAAAFQIYYDNFGDERALVMKNYIKYGTNDEKEIWLLKYGFGFEEIEWLIKHVISINEMEIIFADDIKNLPKPKFELTERYL